MIPQAMLQPSTAIEQLPRALATLVLDDDVRAEREGERRDEPEQHLAQARRRIEVAVNQRGTVRRGRCDTFAWWEP